MFVKDIMTHPVHTIDQNKTAKDAGIMLKKIRRGFLIVTAKRKPVGVLSDSDLIRLVLAANKKPSQIKIKDIMTTRFVSTTSDEDVLNAVRKMRKGNVHRLPVIDNGKIVGVLSLSDVAKTSPELVNVLEMRLEMKAEPYAEAEHTSGLCDNCDNFSADLRKVGDRWLDETCREEAEAEQ